MRDRIVNTLRVMCNSKDIQDKKLLLLAELVETRCDALDAQQEKLCESIKETSQKLDVLTELLENMQKYENQCPVRNNKSDFEKITFFMRYPKISFFVLLGILVLLTSFFGAGILDALKYIFGV